MRHPIRTTLAFGASLSLMLGSIASTAGSAQATSGSTGYVLTLTNAVSGNAVAVYHRASDGTLTAAGSVPTGGIGTGGGLGNQGALTLSPSGNWLLAVNAGSDSITLFRVGTAGLHRTDVQDAKGVRPVSVDIRGGVVYVVNAGSDSIAGFRIADGGNLRPIRGSVRSLSGTATGPAQITFTPDGSVLAVTEKATNTITIFRVGDAGRASLAIPQASAGATPFGFAFSRNGTLVVSEAFGGGAGLSALSSYEVSGNGRLNVISPSVGDTQTAACWVVVTEDGRFAYTTNTASGTVSSYRLRVGGALGLDRAVAGTAGAGPIDMALSTGDGFAYTLNAGADGISGFEVGADGALTPIAGVNGVTDGATGLVAT